MDVTSSPGVSAARVRTMFEDRPGPYIVIRASGSSLARELSQLVTYWELLYFLVWRDTKIRYKQTLIGAGWAVLQPLLTMVIFTAIFSRVVGVKSEGMPYSIFVYTGLVPWTYFAVAVARSGNSLVGNGNLITKVYFPRLIIPLAAVLSPLVDFGMALIVLGGMMLWFQIVPTGGVLVLPLLVLLCAATALSVSLWLSALCVRYRDVGVVIPFVVQIWMYVSPVAYPASLVPAEWRVVYGLNPMVGVIEGFRWALAGGAAPDLWLIGVSCVGVAALLGGGFIYFRRAERDFADVV